VATRGYLSLIQDLWAVEPSVYVFGGFAEDALLDGRVTREHGDVDVLVARAELPIQLNRFSDLGFPDFTSTSRSSRASR
jgi:hypothetical protein